MTDKTPEQLAEAYLDRIPDTHCWETEIQAAFLAGYDAARPKWISVEDDLPPMFENVLVAGGCFHSIARRWTGVTMGGASVAKDMGVEEKDLYEWLTPNDRKPFHIVKYWMPLPEGPKGLDEK
jgi:glycosyltransferase involved in cell wall biosynthesis